MPRQKRDYNQLKLEYFTSKFNSVKSFLSNKLITYNSRWGVNTKGRKAEKMKFKKELHKQAVEEYKKATIEAYGVSEENLLQIKRYIISLCYRKLKFYENKDGEDIDINELEKIWKMTKIELHEPFNVDQYHKIEQRKEDIRRMEEENKWMNKNFPSPWFDDIKEEEEDNEDDDEDEEFIEDVL